MSTEALEQTVLDLQRRVAKLEEGLAVKSREGWKKVAGAAKEDHYFPEAIRLGEEWRRRANKEDS